MSAAVGFGDMEVDVLWWTVVIEIAGRRKEELVEESSEEESGGYEDESTDLVSASAGSVVGMRWEYSWLVAHSFAFRNLLFGFFYFQTCECECRECRIFLLTKIGLNGNVSPKSFVKIKKIKTFRLSFWKKKLII